MTSFRKAQTGKRTYRFGTSISPNKGPVSAQGLNGYRERDMRKQAFNNIGRQPVPTRPPLPLNGIRPFVNEGRPVVPPTNGFNAVPTSNFTKGGAGGWAKRINNRNRPGGRGGKGQRGGLAGGGGNGQLPGGRGGKGPRGNGTFQQPPTVTPMPQVHPFVVDPGIMQQHPTGGPGPVPNGPNQHPAMFANGERPIINPPGNQTPGTRPFNNEGRPNVNGPQPPGGNQQGPWGGQPPSPPQLPQVQVNANGILELPYNQQFAQDQLGYVQDANNQLLGLNQEAGNQGLQFAQGQRDVTQQYGAQQNQTLNQNAVGGTAFSSAYGTQTNNNAKAYANQMGDLQSQNAAFQLQQASERAAIQSMLNMQLQQAAQGYGNDLNEQAGLLGYGQAPIAPVNVNPLGQHGPPPNRRNRRKKKGRR